MFELNDSQLICIAIGMEHMYRLCGNEDGQMC